MSVRSPLAVRGLRVALPDGSVLIDSVDLTIAPGEVVVLLGGSGAGKSTFARVLFERDELEAAGFDVVAAQLDLDRGQLGLVPQRGALFDHLDVRGNLELALRHAEGGAPVEDGDAARWLARVGLDPGLAEPGTAVTALSGGQAQRVAVARVLASRRQLLFLDEPSVGLDPHRVRVLARLIREQVKELGISAIVVTHDIALAAGVADRLFLLSLEHRRLEHLFADRWPGALEDPGHDAAERGKWLVELESVLVDHLEEHGDRKPPAGTPKPRTILTRVGRLAEPLIAPFRVAMIAAVRVSLKLSSGCWWISLRVLTRNSCWSSTSSQIRSRSMTLPPAIGPCQRVFGPFGLLRAVFHALVAGTATPLGSRATSTAWTAFITCDARSRSSGVRFGMASVMRLAYSRFSRRNSGSLS